MTSTSKSNSSSQTSNSKHSGNGKQVNNNSGDGVAALLTPSNNQSMFSCATLTDYLKTLDQKVISTLYQHPATCIAVFRELPALSKTILSRLLFVESAMPQAVITSWVVIQYRSQMKIAQQTLMELGIWEETKTAGGMVAAQINATFKDNLKKALFGGGNPWTMSHMSNGDDQASKGGPLRDISFLDKYGEERWETVLQYMVSSGSGGGSTVAAGISVDAVHVLVASQLITVFPEGDKNKMAITKSGFQFLLMDTPSQVWYFMLQYLNTCHKYNLKVTECLSFLFQLSFSELGKDYSSAGLSKTMLIFLQHLREFGLVYQRKRTHGRFYPTRLALSIASSERKTLSERSRDGYLVVETNYRVYAYTNSDLQISLLALFSELLYRFPNMCVAVITRDSVRQAFRGGITASQIVRFLEIQAHAKQREKIEKRNVTVSVADRDESNNNNFSDSLIPPTVVDQIHLWERERNRFQFQDGVLYNQFLSHSDFETVRNYATKNGHLIWSNERNRSIVVTKEGHDPVRKFWRQHSNNS